jgi:hypothetical protein
MLFCLVFLCDACFATRRDIACLTCQSKTFLRRYRLICRCMHRISTAAPSTTRGRSTRHVVPRSAKRPRTASPGRQSSAYIGSAAINGFRGTHEPPRSGAKVLVSGLRERRMPVLGKEPLRLSACHLQMHASKCTPAGQLLKRTLRLAVACARKCFPCSLTIQKIDSALAFRHAYRQDAPRTLSLSLPRRGRGKCV